MPLFKSSRLNSGYRPKPVEQNETNGDEQSNQTSKQALPLTSDYGMELSIPKSEFVKLSKGEGTRKSDPIKRLRKVAKKAKIVKISSNNKKNEKKNKLLEILQKIGGQVPL